MSGIRPRMVFLAMRFGLSLCVLPVTLVIACARPALTEPVVANTGSARSYDGYEAAVAAAEAGGYRIVVTDEKNAFVRVQSQTSQGSNPSNAVFLDVKAWKGSVDVSVTIPQGLLLDSPRQERVLNERRELAWSVATRARLIAGEPISGSGSSPGAPGSYPAVGNPPFPNSSWVLP